MKRSGFKRKVYDRPQAPAPSKGRAAIMASVSGDVVAVVKDPRYEDSNLLRMAKGERCLLQTPECNRNPETTVACHSNSLSHGKGAARKAHDCYVVYGCSGCHAWLDFGKASGKEKAAVFAAGHERQKDRWRAIANDPLASDRDKKSAREALLRLWQSRDHSECAL